MAPSQAGKCPNCGAPLEFKLGSSRAAVCSYCNALVARHGQDFEAVGKVADLIPTTTKLALDDTGTYEGVGFTLVGRLQYEWTQGVWDEWYASFSDGRWGWLAEAQGRFYMTFRTAPRPLPKAAQIGAGQSFSLQGLGRLVVSDVKEAKIVGVAGEVPELIKVGEAPLSADLEGPRGTFGTIDYGDQSASPVLFLGKQVRLQDLAIRDVGGDLATLKGPRPTGDKLACPNCGAPVELRMPDQAVRAVCASCHALLDAQGPLQLIEVLAKFKSQPALPLGTLGTLRGHDFMVVGWMRRSCTVELVDYPWHEFLLYEPSTSGFVWLVQQDGHWQLAEAISSAEVNLGADAEYKGVGFRSFSSVTGRVEQVLGEFYWAVAVGDASQLDDYIAPPHGLSCETSGREVNWSYVTHLETSEVAEAFHKPGLTQALATGVGTVQPWPYQAAMASLDVWMLLGMLLTFGLLVLFLISGTSPVLTRTFSAMELSSGTPTPPAPAAFGSPATPPSHSHTFLSSPFELGSRDAMEVRFTSQVTNSWAFVNGAVIPAKGGDGELFSLESSSYSGVEGGESWSEGSRSASQALGSLPAGEYVVRADLQWDAKQLDPPPMTLTLEKGGFSFWQFLLALLALLPPVVLHFHRASFEKTRWENSNIGGGSTYTSSFDEDD